MDFSSSKGKFKEQTFEEFTLNGGFKTQPHITVKTIFHEAMLSLSQLHEKKLYHGYISPANMLIINQNEKFSVKFKRTPKVNVTESGCFHQNAKSLMWMAPELIKSKYNNRFTTLSDIFSMGLVFHYLLTNGSSPIKLSSEIVSNELELKFTLNYDHLRNLEESAEIFFAIDLIKDMIKLNPIDRVKDSLHHPLFWRNWQYYEGLKKLHRSCGFYQEDAVMRNEEVINEINQKSQYLTDGLRITEDSILNKIQLIYNGKFDFTTPADIIRGVVHFLNDPVERSKLNPQIAKKIVRKKEDHNEVEDIIVNYVINEIKSQHPFFILHLLKLREDSHSSCKIKTDDLTFKHFPNDILGHGGNGSVVYKGKFQERPIAIKKVFKSNSDIVDREVYSLLKADSHPNTVRYFGTQEQENFYYIGIELCNCNLKEFIKDNKYPCLKKDMASKDIFRHITLGLKHLHKLNIIHRDIKPTNILVSIHESTITIKLSDFGVSKALNATRTFNTVEGVAGTYGWMPPEIAHESNGSSKSSDIFSLGLVFYYVFSDGTILMEKIRTNYDVIQSHLTDLENSSESNMDSFMFDLFKSILKLDPTQRPSLKSILNHPFFWEASKCMDFILNICKKLEILNPNFRKKLIKRISVHNDIKSQTPRLILLKEKLNENVMVINNDWKLHLDDVLMTDFQKGYVGTSVTELLRAIRNKWTHKEELSDKIKKLFCNSPHADSCLVYFTKRFPKLLSHVYKTVEANASDLFPHYFEKSEDRPDNFKKPDRSKMNDKVSFVMDKLDPKLRLEFNKVELKGIDCSNKYDELLDFIEAHQNMINEVVFIESKLTMSFLNKFLNKLPYLRILRFHETNPLNENEKVSHFRPNLIQLKEVEVKNCIGCLEILPKTLDLIRYNSATITKSFVNLIAKQIILHSLEITTDMDINSTRDYKLPSFQLKSLFLKDLSLNELTCTNWIFELARTQNEIENFSLFLTRRTCNQVILKFLSHIMNLSTLTYFDTNINPLIWRYAKPNKNTKQVVLKILLTEGLLYRRFKLNLDKFFPNLTKLELNDLHGHRISHLVPLKLKSLNKLKYLKELGLQNLQMDILIWLGDLDLPELTLFHTSWVIDEMDENFIDLNVNWEQCIGPFFDRSPKIKNLSIQLKSNLNFNLYKNQKMFTDLVSFVLGKLELIEHLEIVENIDYSWFSKVINESNVAEAEFLEEVIKCMFSNSFLKKWKLLQYESET